jgi:hypothetical protein
MEAGIPYIDPNVEHVGVSRLRKLNSEELRTFTKTMVLQENDTPLAVLLKYEQFLSMQNQLKSLLETIELLTDKEEMKSLSVGLQELAAGKTKPMPNLKLLHTKKKR